MYKKKKILIILIVLLVVLVSILLLRSLLEKKQEENKTYSTIEDFKTPKDVVNYLGGEFIKQEESKAEGFEADIYIKFKVDLYTDKTSNEEYYNKMMDMISYSLNYNSFRLIDDSREMLIAVICDSKKGRIKRKYINGDSNYFGNAESQKNLQQMKETKTTALEIQSKELIELLNNNWKAAAINFGEKTGEFNKYDIYEQEGIQVRTVYKKVFNIVFKENYKNPVINGITTNMTEEQIKQILGEPTIKSEDMQIFGYKGNDIYVFFSYGDISIYRVDKYDSIEFAKLVEDYINKSDVKSFVSGITDIWPDYDQYYYDDDFVNLVYTLKGIKIQFNVTKNHGVIVHNNYEGQIIEGMTTQNINTNELHNKIFFKDTNTMLENEITRVNYYIPDPGGD